MRLIRPHDAEIDRDHGSRLGVGEQIAGVHIGMKEAVADGMPQERLQQGLAQRFAVNARGVERRGFADRDARHPAGGEHGFCRVVPAHARDHEPLIILDIFGHLGNRGRLEAQIELEPGGAIKRLDHFHRLQAAQRFDPTLGPGGTGILSFDIGAKALLNAGAQDLDGNILAHPIGHQHGPVHLGD